MNSRERRRLSLLLHLALLLVQQCCASGVRLLDTSVSCDQVRATNATSVARPATGRSFPEQLYFAAQLCLDVPRHRLQRRGLSELRLCQRHDAAAAPISIEGKFASRRAPRPRYFFVLFLQIPLMGCETKMNADGNFEVAARLLADSSSLRHFQNAIIVQDNARFLQSSDKKSKFLPF